MRRGPRHSPAPPRGRRRIGALGLGVLAALSLVWQQQATLASYTDVEHAGATFTAATLDAITPVADAHTASIDISWPASAGDWATPQYALDWTDSVLSGASSPLYAGPGTSVTHATGTDTPASYSIGFTDVAAGATHACGIAQGTLYCWGTATGGLGTGATSATRPTAVTGLAGMTVTDVTAGTNFTCAIADGAAYCWGLGTSGQLGNGASTSRSTPVAVSGLSGTVTAISAGGAHACAVAGGAAYCWGYNNYGQLGINSTTTRNTATAVNTSGVLSGRTVRRIAAGTSHTCAVADGGAFCWGRNTNGQLGNNSTSTARIPVAVYTATILTGRVVSAVSAGGSHSCAIADGKAYCWGQGTSGQLGHATSAASGVPVAVVTGTMSARVTALSAGANATCAVAGGDAWCWGAGTSYALGNNATGNVNTPVAVTSSGVLNGRRLTAISAGTNFGCATGASLPVACWGLGSSYQLGDNANTNNPTPADAVHTGTACPDGSVRTSATTCSLPQGTDYYYRLGYAVGTWTAPESEWGKATTSTRGGREPSVTARTSTSITLGWDAAGAIGDAYPEYTVQRSTSSDGSDPVTIAVTGARTARDDGGLAPTRDFDQISAGLAHTCAILGGELYCWGQNTNGQLGTGDTADANRPTRVTGALAGRTVTDVSVGSYHTCAVADGKAYCWGLNNNGQVGDGSTTNRTSPVLLPNQDGFTVTAVSAGQYHSCGVGNGVAYCWGQNSAGQLGTGTTTPSSVPVPVVATGVLAGLTVTGISAGTQHSCAVAAGGAYCWGTNGSGQLGNGTTTTSTSPVAAPIAGRTVTQISAGNLHTCAVAGGAAYCWGQDSYGQVGDSTTFSTRVSSPTAVSTAVLGGTVAAISAGYRHSCAVAGDRAYCWGEAGNGQLGANSTTDSGVPVAVVTNGALAGAGVSDIAAGNLHSCAVGDGGVYCWGSAANGRQGLGGVSPTGSYAYPQAAVADARCAAGSVPLGDGSCSLASGRTYYYRVSFTLDGTTRTRGEWTGLEPA